MKKRVVFLLGVLGLLCTLSAQAQKTVWNNPVTAHSNTTIINVTKVAMYDDRTELSIHVSFMAGQPIKVGDCFLLVDGKQYPQKDITVLTRGEQFIMPANTLDFKLIFEPVPQNVKSINLIEPNGCLVPNIHPADQLPEGIVDTYWRDDTTGDWLIGFAQDHVVYQNKVYDIASKIEKKDAYTFTLNDGPTIKVGKMKKGLRTITIGGGKPSTCSVITTAALPDYPTKDTRTGFVDNGFRLGDSVTIIGWLKNMPEGLQQRGKEFVVEYQNFLTDEQESAYTKMDTLGRFTLKMPLYNTSEAYIDWDRTHVNAFLEPGKTYFFLYDFWTGQKLWMGDDVRVQNEMLAHPRSRAETMVPYERHDVDLMDYWAKCDSSRLVQEAHLAALQQNHPTLSQRYIDYIGGYYRMLQGHNMMQASYFAPNFNIPQEYFDYVAREFWCQPPKPYTLYRDYSTMNNDFLSHLMRRNNKSEDLPTIFNRLVEQGKVTVTEAEQKALVGYRDAFKKIEADVKAAKTDEERQKLADGFNKSEMVTTLDALFERNEELLSTLSYQHLLDLIDSIGCERPLRDLVLAQRLLQQIDGTRQSLTSASMALAEEHIQLSSALQAVKSLNDKYIALKKRDISKSPSLKSAEDVANMSDGEKILRKIIEPYKGKLILLDIWGTWCGPCKEALAESQHEYERLKEFDMIFFYLANNSPDESWKSVIKEYNVEGENVVHYNLPYSQQKAVENFLGVTGYPTYKLIDRDGTILEVNADPHDLEGFAWMLKEMGK